MMARRTFPKMGRPLAPLGRKRRALGKDLPRPTGVGGANLRLPRSVNYEKIKTAVLAAVERLPTDQKGLIPPTGTLPEIMVALVLCWLGIPFYSQLSVSGGRMFLGGSVVDFIVQRGGQEIAVRVQGSWWHSLPERQLKDIVQFDRLHAKGYLVADIWEHDLYRAWVEDRIKQFVEDSINSAS